MDIFFLSYKSLNNPALIYKSVIKTNFSNIGDQFFGDDGCNEVRRSMAPCGTPNVYRTNLSNKGIVHHTMDSTVDSTPHLTS